MSTATYQITPKSSVALANNIIQSLKDENSRLRIRNATLEERLRQHEELYRKLHDTINQYAGIKGIHG